MSYVEHGGLAAPPGPLLCEDATLWAFLVRADSRQLARECKRVLEIPSNRAVRVYPLLPAVLLIFARLGTVTSTTCPYTLVGHVPEQEVAVFVPVVVRTRRGPRVMPAPRRRFPPRIGSLARVRFAAFITYMFLDNPMSIAAGREIYGYPKNWGWPTFADEPPEKHQGPFTTPRPKDVSLGSLALDAFAIPSFSPDATPDRHRLLTLTPDEEQTSRSGVALESPLAAADWMREQVYGTAGRGRRLRAAILKRLEARLPPITVNQLFIRQLRAAGGGLGADHQDVLTAPATIKRGSWRHAGSLPAYDVQINELASHRIGYRLGIRSGPTIAAFKAQFDFTVGAATTLWKAPEPGLLRHRRRR